MASYLHETVLQNNINKNNDEFSLEKWNHSSNSIDKSENERSDNFDCNICLDTVHDPVVTLCGHLYCWPCIYKWIDLSHKANPLCPICKTEISEKTLIPLYVSTSTAKPNSQEKIVQIPHRPSMPSCGVHVMPCQQHNFHGFQQEAPNVTLPTSPISGMFGEMVYDGIFGNSRDFLFGYGDSYGLAGLSTRRARRQIVRDERSLGRICFFLLCCVMLCLLLF
ncbi:E3 ubiquitin-protein ligase RMA1H1 [Lactuca sativa]|uniref:E3 ubiquitin-protein ligase RMA1H1 n=1 Tax=Lactuca sativa TaxID=4236 RepID=UPI000CD94B74|nr:E3 ubiquitin-protein ligase RMA1H1 [Lactuca sativa]